jgi:eukaryotic-like serine/threonine-protein kinase
MGHGRVRQSRRRLHQVPVTDPVYIGPFLLGDKLGEGGMGEVWAGHHTARGLAVAIKVMTGPDARDPAWAAQFREEVRSAASLRHPGIVVVFDYGEIDAAAERASNGRFLQGSPYLAMECLTGGTLSSWPRQVGWRRTRDVLMALLDALAHAHARDVLHRDIKPSNVVISAAGDTAHGIKLTDFGIAQRMELRSDEGSTEQLSGTIRYMSPEQLRGTWREYGPWTDLYSLGCLAHRLLSGRPPFDADDYAGVMVGHLMREPPSLSAWVPPEVEAWIARLLEKEPRDRFRRAADAAWALAQLPAADTYPVEVAPAAADVQTGGETTLFALLDAPAGHSPRAPRATSTVEADRASPAIPFPRTWRRPGDTERARPLLGAGLGLYKLRPVPLVDRDAERDTIWWALAEVAATGRARAVVVHGAAGTGKSRLAHWMAERAHELGAASILRASWSEVPDPAQGIPRLVGRATRSLGLTLEEAEQRVEDALMERGAGDRYLRDGLLRTMAPALRSAVRRDDSAGSASAEVALDAVAALVRAWSHDRPVMLLLDDAHFGPEALALTLKLLRQTTAIPVLVVLTIRDEDIPVGGSGDVLDDVERLAQVERLDCEPLPPSDHAELVRDLLCLEGELAQRVESRTQGNPLFAVQLVGDWVERGWLEFGEEGFRLRTGIVPSLPDDLHRVWADRVEHLTQTRRDDDGAALEVASLLGEVVMETEWQLACSRAGLAPTIGLVEALREQRLALSAPGGFRFVHGMLRESLTRRAMEAGRLRGHHSACADALSGLRAYGAGHLDARIGRHLLAAERFKECLRPLFAAARAERERGHYGRVHGLLAGRDRALRALRAGDGDRRFGEGWLLRAQVCRTQGRPRDAASWLELLTTRAEAHGWDDLLARALLRRGGMALDGGDLDSADVLFARAERLLDDLRDERGIAETLRRRGQVAQLRGDLGNAEVLYEHAAERSEAADPDEFPLALVFLGNLYRDQERWESAVDIYRAALKNAVDSENRFGQSFSLVGLADVARLRGDYDEADRLYAEALHLRRLVGATDAAVQIGLGRVLLGRRRYDEATRALGEVAAQLGATGREGMLGGLHASLAACATGRGDWQAFEEHVLHAEAYLPRRGMTTLDAARDVALAAAIASSAGRTEQEARARALAARLRR